MNNMLNSMKEYEKNLKKESAEYLAIENAQLEERINKAIEYIDKAILEIPFEQKLPMKYSRWGENLVEILKGDNND